MKRASGFNRPDLGLEFFRAAEQAALSLPGVSSTALVGTLPGGRPVWQSVRIEPPQLPLRDVEMDVAAFTPRSLDVVTVPPIAGRMFGGEDTSRTCTVAIVNEEAARDLFDGDAVGRSIEDPGGQRVEIIGVVADADGEDAGGRQPAIARRSSTTRSRPARRWTRWAPRASVFPR